MTKQHHCKNCNKIIDYRAIRCHSCALKERLKHLKHNCLHHKHGKTNNTFCLDCKKKID